jgi:hypothetical protein
MVIAHGHRTWSSLMVIAQVFYDSESSSVQHRAWCQALRATGGPPDPIAGRILSSRPARHGPSQAYAKFTCIEAALESHFHSTLGRGGGRRGGLLHCYIPGAVVSLETDPVE